MVDKFWRCCQLKNGRIENRRGITVLGHGSGSIDSQIFKISSVPVLFRFQGSSNFGSSSVSVLLNVSQNRRFLGFG